ncbi:hypothetical protein FXE80_00535 [Vibrio cholerae]|uniref:hypothetical protein n=1 Tax=Vibrio cholerae TaxID=666 RepID=UPI0011DBEF91|nr:hypothetical protein [Vibrio cholerae]TXY77872.1 hypothetical protein FXE80_00535 [Vibrio cholerae]GIB16304.1 hypothetical protein VCSRO90_2687 [Vibrio cholerae]
MNKAVKVQFALLLLAGCVTTESTMDSYKLNESIHLYRGNLILETKKFEVDSETNTEVILFKYIDDKDQLCIQWVSDAKKTTNPVNNQSDINATVSVHCGEYKKIVESNAFFGGAPNERHYPSDLHAIYEFMNSEGLRVQGLGFKSEKVTEGKI